MAQNDTFTLFDLNEYLKRVIALNFPEPVWISCEIAQIKNARGNYYLDLVQQNEKEEVIAQSQAAIWYKSYLFLKAKLGDLLNSLLQEGTQIKIKVNVEYNERYGLKLIIEDIDPAYTLGQMEISRQKILERLKTAGVTELNKTVSMPRVIQRIAVISSDTAAGFKDFTAHLEENKYGYQFTTTLFPAAMQGQNTEKEVVSQLHEIKLQKQNFDAVVIIRGGGSKLDLAYFDNYNIGYAIATMPIPVLTGIGHEIDLSIADLMAHLSLKTPTAVADFMVDHALHFESQLDEFHQQTKLLAGYRLQQAALQLENNVFQLHSRPREVIRFAGHQLESSWNEICQTLDISIKNHQKELTSISTALQLSDPSHILKRGFVMVKQMDKYISRIADLDIDQAMSLTFYDGKIEIPKSN